MNRKTLPPNLLIWAIYGPSMEMIWHNLWALSGQYMDLVWATGFHIKPVCGTVFIHAVYNSSVLYYEIARHLAEIHWYPVGTSVGMMWLRPIPIPHGFTMGMLRIWHISIQFTYPGTPVYDMGMLWGFGKYPYNSPIIQACCYILYWDLVKSQYNM